MYIVYVTKMCAVVVS